MIKNALFVLLVLLLSACGSKLDGTYSNGSKIVDMSFIFKPDGIAQMSIGGTTFPAEMPYEVSGKKVTITGQKVLVLTIVDDGDLLGEGMRFKKVGAK